MELLQQAIAIMIVGMAIVFSMLVALIGVITLNARVMRFLKLDRPAPVAGTQASGDSKPIAAIIAAAIHAHENFHTQQTKSSKG